MNTTQTERLQYLTGAIEAVKQGLADASSAEARVRRMAEFCQDLKKTFGDRLMIRFDSRIPEHFHYQFECPVPLEYRSEAWDTILVGLFDKVEGLLTRRRGAVFQWAAIYEKHNTLRADYWLEKGLLPEEDFHLLNKEIEQACLEAEEKSKQA